MPWDTLKNTDFDELYRQKMYLIEHSDNSDEHEGLISFLDFLLDEAEERGLCVHPDIRECLSVKRCNRCNTPVEQELGIEEYPYYCPECDENMYEFESQ